jgi:hypothetical protein
MLEHDHRSSSGKGAAGASVLVGSILLLCQSALAQSPLKIGLWEVKNEAALERLDGSLLRPAQVHSRQGCMSKEYVATDPYMSPDATLSARVLGATCTVAGYKRVDNTATWAVQCEIPGGNRSVTRYRATVDETTYQLISESTETDSAGSTLVLRFTSSGRYLGECPPGARPLK